MSISAAEFTAWRGKFAQEWLDSQQLHIAVDGQSGRVRVRECFYEMEWANMAQFLASNYRVPPYGRVWVHVE